MKEWQAERLLRRVVVDARRAEYLGEVADVVFDPQRQQLAGLLIGPAGAAGSLLEAVRSRFGGPPIGLRMVEAQHIVGLKGDVVVVNDLSSRQASTPPRAHLPRLTEMQGLAVVTVEGTRIGRFADLLLNRDGRAIAGYLVDAAPHDASQRPASHEPQAHTEPQAQTREQALRETARPSDADALVVVSVSTPIRMGRDVIIVGELGSQRQSLATASTRAPIASNETPNETPVVGEPNGHPAEWPAPEADAMYMPGDHPAAAQWPPHDMGDALPDAPTVP